MARVSGGRSAAAFSGSRRAARRWWSASCSASYRIDVPNDVPISIRTEHGDIRLDGYRGSADIATNSGAINVEGYCGFVLGAASASGDVTVTTACSPERLTLRSDSGDVSATVPPGELWDPGRLQRGRYQRPGADRRWRRTVGDPGPFEHGQRQVERRIMTALELRASGGLRLGADSPMRSARCCFCL